MTSARFKLPQWTHAGNDLLERSRSKLSSAPSEKIRLLAERIPASVVPADDRILVVFAGQYSAGKSTLIKALTGREDIEIGPGITTAEVRAYDWSGVQIVDTPGVHTELRPDHDEISYRAIANADLVVFVVTNELFDSHLAAHFRTLAIEREKAHEMMLVVNKMRRCAKGNSPEAQNVLREDLRKVLAPFTPEQLRTTFIDAAAALESKTEPDKHVAEALWRKSGIDAFMDELNRFVREKGLIGRYTTALYVLEQVLEEAIASESTGDVDVDGLEELLLQRRQVLLETRDRIKRALEGQIEQTAEMIRQEGRKIADMIHGSSDRERVDQELQAAQRRVERYAEELLPKIEATIAEHLKGLEEQIGSIANSELARQLLPRLKRRIEQAGVSPQTISNFRSIADVSQRLGAFLVRHSFTPQAGSFAEILSLGSYSGTAAHSAIKGVGHFLGHSFRPWQAVQWTRLIANVGRVLAVAGIILTFILDFVQEAQEERVEEELRESRARVRAGFNDAAHALTTHYGQGVEAYLDGTLMKEIEGVDKQLAELRDMQQTRTALFSDLQQLLEETRSLIRTLHSGMAA